MPSLNLHCYCFDVYTKKGMEINIFDLSKHSIKMATAQKRDLQPNGSIEQKTFSQLSYVQFSKKWPQRAWEQSKKKKIQLLIFIILSVLPDTRGEAIHVSQEHSNRNWNFKRANNNVKKIKNLLKNHFEVCYFNQKARSAWMPCFNHGGWLRPTQLDRRKIQMNNSKKTLGLR